MPGGGFVTTYDDITERKQKEEQLRDSKEQLEIFLQDIEVSRGTHEQQAAEMAQLAEEQHALKQRAEAADKSKSEFLASMSHEIRTPMTGVMGFADLLLDDDLPEDSREKVFHIKDSTRALLRLINDILDLSKLEANKMEIEYIDLHLPSLIEDVLVLFREKRKGKRRKDLELELTLSEQISHSINSDSTRLRQILLNLVGNAVKFTEKGLVEVSVTLKEKEENAQFLHFSIQDSGIGMTEETMTRLFTNFTQADASISRRYQGSGLGLSICKRIVDLMGGEIGVNSEIDKGSEFWFDVPYKVAETDVDLSQRISSVTTFTTNKQLKILAAEDNKLNQKIIRATIENYGHQIEFADNGAVAVDMHQANGYDLILMDVRMPEMSGPDATKVIRKLDGKKSGIPIIALTADAMAEHKVAYKEAGMNDVVTKPIDRTELLEAINKVMGDEIHTPQEVEVKSVANSEAKPPERADVEKDGDGNDEDLEDFLQHLQDVADGVKNP